MTQTPDNPQNIENTEQTNAPANTDAASEQSAKSAVEENPQSLPPQSEDNSEQSKEAVQISDSQADEMPNAEAKTPDEKSDAATPIGAFKIFVKEYKLPGDLEIIPPWAVKVFTQYSLILSAMVLVVVTITSSFLAGILAAALIGAGNAALAFCVAKVLAEKLAQLPEKSEEKTLQAEPCASHYSGAVDAQNLRLDKLEQNVEFIIQAVDEIQNLIEEEEIVEISDQPQWFEQSFPDPDAELYPEDEDPEEAQEDAKAQDADSEEAPQEVKPHWSEDHYPDPDKPAEQK